MRLRLHVEGEWAIMPGLGLAVGMLELKLILRLPSHHCRITSPELISNFGATWKRLRATSFAHPKFEKSRSYSPHCAGRSSHFPSTSSLPQTSSGSTTTPVPSTQASSRTYRARKAQVSSGLDGDGDATTVMAMAGTIHTCHHSRNRNRRQSRNHHPYIS